MSTHQLREALELATHVALLNRGKIAFHGERTPGDAGRPRLVYRALRRGLMDFFRQTLAIAARICARSCAPRKPSTPRWPSRW